MSRRSLIDTLLAPRIAALLDVLPAALAGEPEAVHRARVGSRRLRELLPPLRAVVATEATERARDEVKRVTRALGPVRELDVAIALFDELAETHILGATARLAVRRALVSERDTALRRLRATMSRRRRDRLAEALGALAASDASPGSAASPIVAAATARVVRRSRRVRKALDRAGALYVPERLHKVRIAVKQLRYALEVAGDARRARRSARVTELRLIQDLLGRAHDLHVLGERVRAVQARIVRTSRATASELGRLAKAIDIACRAAHASYMSRRSGLLTLCEAVDSPTPVRRQSVA
jgi:CHAD domain-containing protein